jgi:hypothetical protein
MSDNDGNEGVDFVYTRQDNVPRDVTSVTVHPSIGVIGFAAFYKRSDLTTVILGEGLEEIGKMAFRECTSLHEVVIPPRVWVIGGGAFLQCTRLMTVIIGMGLEEIGEEAFRKCTSLHHVVIPPSVREIRPGAFCDCTHLATVDLGQGLEELVNAHRYVKLSSHLASG